LLAFSVLAAALVACAAGWGGWRAPGIQPGDVLIWLERAAALRLVPMPRPWRSESLFTAAPAATSQMRRLEEALRTWPMAGGLWLLVLIAMAAALLAA
jgi:hypothetical protein